MDHRKETEQVIGTKRAKITKSPARSQRQVTTARHEGAKPELDVVWVHIVYYKHAHTTTKQANSENERHNFLLETLISLKMKKAQADIIIQSIFGLAKQHNLYFSFFQPDTFQNQLQSWYQLCDLQTNSSTTFKYKLEPNSTLATQTDSLFFSTLAPAQKTSTLKKFRIFCLIFLACRGSQ